LAVTCCYFLLLWVLFSGVVRVGGRGRLAKRRTKKAQKSWSAYFSRFHVVSTPKPPNDDPFPCAENIFRLDCLVPFVRREASKGQVCSVFAAGYCFFLPSNTTARRSSAFLLTRVPAHPFVFVSARACVRVGVDFLHGDAQRGHGGQAFAYRICQFRILGNNC
jgi:hypothetical protein